MNRNELADFLRRRREALQPDDVGLDAGPRRRTRGLTSEQNPAYGEVREVAASRPTASNPGDPQATRSAILKVVDAEEPPLRIFFGEKPLDIATEDYESRLAEWNEWQSVSVEAHGN